VAFGYAAINITRSAPGELDKTLALKLLPPGVAGVYAVATRVVGAITLPVSAMMLSALPRLFREGRGSHKTAYLLGKIYAVALCYSLLLAGVVWLFAPIFGSVFGEQYQGISEVIRWLCPAIPAMALRMVIGSALMAMGKPWMRVGLEITGLVLLVICAVVLIDCLGIMGLPLALACAEWTMTIIGSGMIVYLCSVRGGDERSQKKTEGA
jgi:O-antigen/teichoic acid export membrane protein